MTYTRTAVALGLAAVLAACSARGIPETADPPLAEAAIRGTAPAQPLRVIFDWRILERDARFNGSGAARLEPPYRARVDLFGPSGDGYLSAALVDHEVRLPPGVRAPQIPPPAMFWAALGVVRPPTGAVLQGTREVENGVELYYRVDGDLLRYELEAGRLAVVEWRGDARRMSVRIDGWTPEGLPRRSHYRDFNGYTELIMDLQEVDEVEPYPPEIWTPGS